jgi:hypothetical protein
MAARVGKMTGFIFRLLQRILWAEFVASHRGQTEGLQCAHGNQFLDLSFWQPQ